jgi:hypothetical protein
MMPGYASRRLASDIVAISIYLRQQRRLLLRAPNPPAIRRPDNVLVAQKCILL